MRWRAPTRAQAWILAVACLVSLAGAGAIVWWGRPGPPTPASVVEPVVAPAESSTPTSDLATVTLVDLPDQAIETLALLDRGGPFPYEQDATVFGNVERRLPDRPRGYYREYTVPTPGMSGRGVRRLVVGAEGDVYYTADHYESFRQLRR